MVFSSSSGYYVTGFFLSTGLYMLSLMLVVVAAAFLVEAGVYVRLKPDV